MENIYDETDLVSVKIKTESFDKEKDKKFQAINEGSTYGAL